ncbi:MAG: dTDP-4-dehydrorhamnose reductase [Pseudomonadota bacterium]
MGTLIFGKSGQVAQCLMQEGPGDILALGRDDADLTVSGTAAAAIEKHRPDIVINAAAYTAVDNAEEDENAARSLNADAVAEIARASQAVGATFLHISTDYVFDGTQNEPYTEDHPTNPLNFYGQSKLDGEKAAIDNHGDAIVLRTSWVFSEFGGNFVKTMLRLSEERDSLTIVGDQIGGPTSARDIARTLLAIAERKQSGPGGAGLFHYQGAPAVSWADFARAIFAAAGRDVAVTDIATSDYPTPARRPLQTVLDCSRLENTFGIAQPDWRKAMKNVIATLN